VHFLGCYFVNGFLRKAQYTGHSAQYFWFVTKLKRLGYDDQVTGPVDMGNLALGLDLFAALVKPHHLQLVTINL
jgi:hypothetical protein